MEPKDFEHSEYNKGIFSLYRHPFLFAANSKAATVMEIIGLHVIIGWAFTDESSEASPLLHIQDFLWNVISPGFSKTFCVLLWLIGELSLWIAIGLFACLVLGKVFKVGKFK